MFKQKTRLKIKAGGCWKTIVQDYGSAYLDKTLFADIRPSQAKISAQIFSRVLTTSCT
ncbi:MAG: hypothetical protein J6C85_06625 [Alphaproteobacteria bacterium]|nr:hypothetical protein [Alphaproteobacteria bacterium]